MPENLRELIKIQYRNGYSSAFVFKFWPNLSIETPNNYDTEFIARRSLLYRTFRFVGETMDALMRIKLYLFVTNISYRTGYIYGLVWANKSSC